MPVVGVWAETGAHELAQSRAGTTAATSAGCAALAGAGSGRSAQVGQTPTCSEISIDDDKLVLARGAAWTAPIYYRSHSRSWIASSSLEALVEPDDELDVARIAAMIAYASERGESRTVYRDIRLVKPFETVTITRLGLRSVERAAPRLEPRTGTLDELAGELRVRLLSVIERAAGTHRVGLMLSGGLDSSSMLAALLSLRGARAEDVSVTLDFEAPGCDRPHVLALERHYGIQVVRVRPNEVSTFDALVMDAAPSRHHGDSWTVACARRAHARGAEMLMTGTGGDQHFGGTMGFGVRNALLEHDVRGAWDTLRAVHPYPISARYRVRMALGAMIRPHLPAAVHVWRGTRQAGRRVPSWAGRAVRDELLSAFRVRAERPAPRDPQARFEDHLWSAYESEYCGEARAQTDTLSPIPRVDPLYDDELVQFLAAIPHQALFAGGTYRGLLRLAMRGLLPESVRMRIDKSDFEPAFAEAICPFDRFGDLLSFEALDAAGIVIADEFQRHLAPLYAGPAASDNGPLWLDFWPALAAEKFLRDRST